MSNGATLVLEMDGEDQMELRGMSIANFRDTVEDLVLHTYFMMGSVYPGEGEKQML